MRDQMEGVPMDARTKYLQQEDNPNLGQEASMEDPSNVSVGEQVNPTPTDTGGRSPPRRHGKSGRTGGSISFGQNYTGPVAHHESLPYQQEEEPIFNQPPEESPSDAAFQQIQQQKEAEAAQAEAMKRVSAQREAALRARVMQRPLSNMRNRRRGQGPASRNNQRRRF